MIQTEQTRQLWRVQQVGGSRVRRALTLLKDVRRGFDESDIVTDGLLDVGEGEEGYVIGVDVLID